VKNACVSFYNDADANTQALLDPLLDDGASCDLADTDGLTPYIKRQICVAGGCRPECRHYFKCRYVRYLAAANDPKVDFLITNHNYFLADILHRAGG
jgi:Rad3-related DNA helicase